MSEDSGLLQCPSCNPRVVGSRPNFRGIGITRGMDLCSGPRTRSLIFEQCVRRAQIGMTLSARRHAHGLTIMGGGEKGLGYRDGNGITICLNRTAHSPCIAKIPFHQSVRIWFQQSTSQPQSRRLVQIIPKPLNNASKVGLLRLTQG